MGPMNNINPNDSDVKDIPNPKKSVTNPISKQNMAILL